MKDPNKLLRSLTESVNKLYEQAPAGGVGFGASNAPPQLPRISGDFGGLKVDRSAIANITAGLYGLIWPSFPRWDMSPKWVEQFDAYLDAGGAWQKEVEIPWPPYAINASGETVTYAESDVYDAWVEDGSVGVVNPGNSPFWFWVSFMAWFVGDTVSATGATGDHQWRGHAGNPSPLYRIWMQAGQPEIPQSEIVYWGAFAQGSPYVLWMFLTGRYINGDPIPADSPAWSIWEILSSIISGGQWGEGGQD